MPEKGAGNTKIWVIGLDIAKSVFHSLAVNQAGKPVKKKMLTRQKLLSFFSQLEICLIAMEVCCGAHYWAREFQALGHQVRLIAWLTLFALPCILESQYDTVLNTLWSHRTNTGAQSMT